MPRPQPALFAMTLLLVAACGRIGDSNIVLGDYANSAVDIGGVCGEHDECEGEGDDATTSSVAEPQDLAKSDKKKNNCVPTADANAKHLAGMEFEGGMSTQEAADEIEACLKDEGCWNGCGFGPADPESQAQWDACMEALCECNDHVLVGDLMCEYIPIGNGVDASVCEGHQGAVGFIRNPGDPGSHAVTITGFEPMPPDTLVTFIDPDDPDDGDQEIIVEPGGEIDESSTCWIRGGAHLAGCFVFNQPL